MADDGQNLGGAPPIGTGREIEHEVAIQAKPSLFCVLVNLRREDEDDDFDEAAKKRYDKVGKAVRVKEKGKKSDLITIPCNSGERQSTGFAVATNGNKLRILTCAHVISDIYTQGKHQQLTRVDLFKFGVHCVHQESEICTMVSGQMISERTRMSTPANVVALDTELDLLVLEVEVGELCVREDNEKFQIACEEYHPLIHFANENPIKMDKVVLAGWPPQKSGATVTRQVSLCDLSYDAVTALNIKGYTMRLLKVSGMAGDDGFSGSPVLNGHGQCVGVYHGVFNLINGYAISLTDVKAFLGRHNMLVWGPNEP